MAISQKSVDKVGMAMVNEEVGGVAVMRMGNVHFATGTGAPADGASGDLKASPKGSLYIDTNAGKTYTKTSAADASVTWVIIGTIES